MPKNKQAKEKFKKEYALKNALFEVGLEEVPSRFMPAMLADLKEKAEKELLAARLFIRSVQTYGTPRRLVLYIEGLPAKQADIAKEVKGPAKEIAYSNGHTPTKAAEGFAKSQGVAVGDLKLKKIGDREFVFASVKERGLAVEEVLEKLFPQIIRSLYLPISMHWGNAQYKFIRPIHWIFAACGSKALNIEIGGIKAGTKTFGHRFVSAAPITINIAKGVSFTAFKDQLKKGRVMLDQDERRQEIVRIIKDSAKKLGGDALIGKDLLEEVNYLVEWPEGLTGAFKKEYLELPRDVLVTVMKKHQKYFSVLDGADKLLPCFIAITNGVKKDDLKHVREGNEKVLAARLADARFFFAEDRKKFLEDLVPNLTKVAFYEKLGSVYEKVERITALSAWIAKEIGLSDRQKENIKEISKLCKADLLTQMVYELSELQGIMGREYALIEGKSKDIANGIFEHYLPRNSEDILPTSLEGAVVGIADKIDSIVGCFSIGLIPTGSADPFALRRQAHGIVAVLLNKKINLALDLLVDKAYKLYEPLFLGELFASGKVKYNDAQKVIPEVLAFLAVRLKGILIDEKIGYDTADAVISVFDDVLDCYQRAKVITSAIKEEWFKGIVFTADRVKRLAANAKRDNVVESDFASPEERSLNELYLNVNYEMGEALEKGDYAKALKDLARMTKPVDDFFVKVMVMDKDEKLRNNRLALLKTIDRMYMEVADFSKIVM